MWITYRHEDSDLPLDRNEWTFQQKIEIFEARIFGWQLDILDKMMNGKIDQMRHAGFAAINIGLFFFEIIAKYYYGFCKEGESAKYFKAGIDLVYPNDFEESVKIKLYHELRCGMYHTGMFKNGGLSTLPKKGIIYLNDIIYVNPHKLGPDLIEYLKMYVSKIKKDKVLRNLFEKRFNYDNFITRKS